MSGEASMKILNFDVRIYEPCSVQRGLSGFEKSVYPGQPSQSGEFSSLTSDTGENSSLWFWKENVCQYWCEKARMCQ